MQIQGQDKQQTDVQIHKRMSGITVYLLLARPARTHALKYAGDSQLASHKPG